MDCMSVRVTTEAVSASCCDRVEYGGQPVGPSAGQHHIPQQVPE